MKLRVATDSILASRFHGRMFLASTRRRFLLLCALATGAFIATLALLHFTGSGTSGAGASLGGSPVQGTAEGLAAPHEKAELNDPHGISVQPNPAAQKAGPPNPDAQSTAAASAESAAQAAADLASKSRNP
jgi:hypothetical protein